jgi:hypothetical protein
LAVEDEGGIGEFFRSEIAPNLRTRELKVEWRTREGKKNTPSIRPGIQR